jgi:heterodisulfide reductase subunit B
VREALSAIGLSYNGTVKVRHIVEVLFNDVGPAGLAAKVVRPLTGLKAACYAGCQQVRPSYGFDDSEYPDWLDQMAQSLGAEPVNFPLKARCCGSSLVISESDVALDLIHRLLQNAQDNGAQCIVSTTCPLCFTALDVYQPVVNGMFKKKFNLPVLAITQMIAIALGLDIKASALDGNVVSPNKLLKPFLTSKPQADKAETPA